MKVTAIQMTFRKQVNKIINANDCITRCLLISTSAYARSIQIERYHLHVMILPVVIVLHMEAVTQRKVQNTAKQY